MLYLIRSMLAVAFLLPFTRAGAQTSGGDSTAANAKIREQLIANFHNAVGRQAGLYNGPSYEVYPRNIKGTAYLNGDEWKDGAIIYDKVLYRHVQLRYDIYKDLVVTILYNHFSLYSLISERVSSFDVDGKHFINIRDSSLLRTGYYEELYTGPTQILLKHIKDRQNRTEENIIAEFEDKLHYYARVNGHYFEISSQGDFLNAMKPRKKEIQAYLKTNHLKFRKDKANVLVAVAAFYDKTNSK